MKKNTLGFTIFILVFSGFLNLGYACKYWKHQTKESSKYNQSFLNFLDIGLDKINHSFFFEDESETMTYIYSQGNINTLYISSPTVNTTSTCPGTLTVTVPDGKRIASVSTEYNITALGGGFKSDQKSYIYSPTLGIGETTLTTGTGASSGIQTYSRVLPFANEALSGSDGTITFELHAFRTYGGTGCGDTYNYVVDNTWKLIVVFEDIPSCLPPTEVELTDVTSGSATLNWTATTSENDQGYSYEVRTSGESGSGEDGLFVSGTTAPGTTSVEIEDLDANMTYHVYVKANCTSDDESAWTPDVSFTTPCTATDVTYIMPIDATTGTALPDCVTREDLNNDGKTWDTTVAQAGITGRVMRYSYHSANVANDWFYTQGLNLTEGIVYRLRFKYKNSGYQEKLRVSYGTENTYTAMLNELYTVTTGTATVTEEEAIYFSPETTGVYYIGFQAFSNAYMNYLYVGEIIVDVAPDCPEPSHIVTNEITDNSIEVEWQQYGDADTWEVIILPDGENIPEDESELEIITVTGEPNVVIDELDSGTIYNIYIRAICDEEVDQKSEWSLPKKEETLPPPPIRTSDDEYTVEELVKEVLIKAPCDLVSNISYITGSDFSGNSNSIGYFDKNGSKFLFEDGIILATNGIQYAPGPAGSSQGYDTNAWLGDADLQDILTQAGQTFQNYNASVLEFDFIPVTDTISFDFIFASNEYGPSFQCGWSDIFAFLLTDLQTNVRTNLAVIPGTNIPVSVTTIHSAAHQGSLTCGDANPEYFDKYYGSELYNGLPTKFAPINYAGMTIPMQAVSAVVPGRKYHIKLAIADYRDNGVNSAVFLRGGSFDLGTVDFGEDLTVEDNNALCEEGTYTLDSGLNPEWVEISWYKDDVLIPGAEDPVYEVTEPGEYTVVGRYTAVEDSDCEVEQSIKIEFYPTIKETLQQPEGVDYCRNSLEDTMDLTVVEEGMFSGVGNKGDYSIEYYESEADREAQENAIVSPSEFAIPGGTTKTIYIHVINTVSGCEGDFEFTLNPVAATIPANPGDKQVCAVYEFPELPDNQYYYSGSKATGTAYKAGDVLEDAGSHEIYIYSISANGKCYEEISYTVRVTAPVEGYELDDVELQCENYILPALPEGSAYYTLSGEEGDKLEAGDEVRLAQTIYIFTKSAEGPDYCTAETSFTVDYKDCPLPKGFSPNGDGVNDYLDLGIYGVTGIKVYNRNGVEVFSQGVYNSEWNGQDKSGNALPSGTYYYVIESHGKIKTGWIQISR